ncbi:MAG: hypothetical protein E7161_04715 [Firmicutes bacterium]|nr:hypothetical protein [Bacillota bacterium]
MKEKRIKELKQELKYLVDTEIKKEIEENIMKLEDSTINIKDLAREIYLKRGLDITKFKIGVIDGLINIIGEMVNLFKNRDKDIKKKMVLEIIYIAIILVLIKIPFDLVRDIGYEYIELLSTNILYYNLWNLAFLLIYTITIICTFIVFIRNFNNKYKDTKVI